ncbi:MAG TPA: nucleotidyltransferase family protein [Terriglobales bacterium]|jgi:NDP-sugar pyrophosphorylase family protein
MKAMVLAAGLGTRLRPLTNDRPKALVEVAGRTLLEITLSRLRKFGVREVIINVHHLAKMIEDYLRENRNFGMHIELSREEELLLDTGGGLKKAGYFFQDQTGREEPFILHNVDVISNIDLNEMLKCHLKHEALATLALHDRQTSRYLLFDDDLQLCGRKAGRDGKSEFVRQVSHPRQLAFSGIHIVSPRLISMITEQGVFSIIQTYLRLAAAGERISAFRADEYYWRDLGKSENISQAAEDFESGRIS